MRRGLLLAATLLLFASSATAARRDAGIQATPGAGADSLHFTFTAPAGATAAHWDFGDGSTADGLSVEHTYGAGQWTVTATLTTQAGLVTQQLPVTAYELTLASPRILRYGKRSLFRGALAPAAAGVPVTVHGPTGAIAHAQTRADGSFAVRVRAGAPGTYAAVTDRAATKPLQLQVVPRLSTSLVGSGARGSVYVLSARLHPAGAGGLHVVVSRRGTQLVDRDFGPRIRLRLSTAKLATYRIKVVVLPTDGFVEVTHLLVAHVVLPRLAYGSSGTAVAQLVGRLHALHYATPFTATFGSEILDAVYAFEKVQGLPRTGIVDAAFWQRLASPRVPAPRYAQPGDHIEIDKARQVLYVVRSSQIALIIPVSTAGIPGYFTPVGRFAIYRKVNGFDNSPLGTLYDPMYFTGGYAIHGNPSVPPFPASHGCVRVPMWIAGYLFATNPYGEAVYVY